MKKYPAMAAVEFKDISTGMYATDAMLKKSPIGFIKCGSITNGRYMTLIGGSTASVQEAVSEGLFWGGGNVIDEVTLADVHPQLHDAILGKRLAGGDGTLAILETPTVCSNIRSAEKALKGTTVKLVEIRLADAGLHGKGLSIFQGELYDVEAAVDIAVADIQDRGLEATWKIITAPHEALHQSLGAGSWFPKAGLLELDGEELN